MNKVNSKLINCASEIANLAHAMLDAEHFMQRVHFADRLQSTWLQMEGLIEHFLKTGKSEAIEESSSVPRKDASSSGIGTPAEQLLEGAADGSSQFRDRTLADAAAALLATHGTLHGSKIEQLLRRGGYRSRSRFFQNVLDSAFKRDGRFRNLGRNVWQLKEPLLSSDRSEQPGEEHGPAPDFEDE
jgi:hypothetical protein